MCIYIYIKYEIFDKCCSFDRAMNICRQLYHIVKVLSWNIRLLCIQVATGLSLYCYLLAKFDCAAKPLTAMRRYDALHLDSDDALRSIGNTPGYIMTTSLFCNN